MQRVLRHGEETNKTHLLGAEEENKVPPTQTRRAIRRRGFRLMEGKTQTAESATNKRELDFLRKRLIEKRNFDRGSFRGSNTHASQASCKAK